MPDSVLHPDLEDVAVAETPLSRIDGRTGEPVIGDYPIDETATEATYEESVSLPFEDRLPDADELAALRADLADRGAIGPPSARSRPLHGGPHGPVLQMLQEIHEEGDPPGLGRRPTRLG